MGLYSGLAEAREFESLKMAQREGRSFVCSGGMACFSFRPPGGLAGRPKAPSMPECYSAKIPASYARLFELLLPSALPAGTKGAALWEGCRPPLRRPPCQSPPEHPFCLLPRRPPGIFLPLFPSHPVQRPHACREASPLRGLPRLSRAYSNGKAFPCLARSGLRNHAGRLSRGTAKN